MPSKALNLGLRGLELFCTVIVLALIGNMIATAVAGNPSIVNYDMFVAVLGFLSLLYLIPTAFMTSFYSPVAAIALDGANTLFWLIGGIATAAKLGAHSCSNESYLKSNPVTNGSVNMGKRCREAQASTAFLWFGFAAFAASFFFSVLEGRSTGANLRGIRRGGPSMSQV